ILDAFSSCSSSTNKNLQLSYSTLILNSGFITSIVALICFQKCNTTAPQCKHALTVTFNVILSYAVLLIESKDEEGQSQVLSAALEIVEDENVGPDSKFRALVAVGSLMLEGLVKKIALDFDVLSIAKAAKGSKDSKIAEVGSDIELVSKQS
ncbi:phospholipase A-2-activating protein, partial [Trifolium pratense]